MTTLAILSVFVGFGEPAYIKDVPTGSTVRTFDEVIRLHGVEPGPGAQRELQRLVRGKYVEVIRRADSTAVVKVNRYDVGFTLISRGVARVRGVSPSLSAHYKLAEQQARLSGSGDWAGGWSAPRMAPVMEIMAPPSVFNPTYCVGPT